MKTFPMKTFPRLILTLAGLTALGVAGTRPASAQALLFTLSGVTFSDGATASGSFVYDPSSTQFNVFDVTTTNGVSDNLAGFHYTPQVVSLGYPAEFQFVPGDPYHSSTVPHTLLFQFSPVIGLDQFKPGVYSLLPGTLQSDGKYSGSGSGEFTAAVGSAPSPNGIGRTIASGSLVVTSDSPVPEASTTVSLGLLLLLGAGGAAVAARRKHAI